MGDHFVLLVDRLITESTLEAAIESRNQLKKLLTSPFNDAMTTCSSEFISTPRKVSECRICQDEDLDSNMETPCSCCGILKYDHRRCVQRWCNEKGDTVCEICHQFAARVNACEIGIHTLPTDEHGKEVEGNP